MILGGIALPTLPYKMQPVIVFTDGSCYPNDGTGPGGWAFKCQYKGQTVVKFGSKSPSTNNEMELEALHHALKYVPFGERYKNPLHIFTDSSYCHQTMTKWGRDWRCNDWMTSTGGQVKNKELIETMLDILDLHLKHRDVKFTLIKGHSGIEENEEVDKLAKEARLSLSTNWKAK